jgi:hypothetical protein
MKSTGEHDYKSNLRLRDKDLTFRILLQVCGPDEVQDAIDILPSMLQVTCDAYDRTQKCYTENDLHGLP